jgi:uncharacterized membrane protein YeaQ/YmgE (transglycosylase-associated protein family)
MGGIIVLVLIGLVALIALSTAFNLFFAVIIPVLIWAVIGWLAGQLMRGRGYGALGNILLGLGGGILGGLLFSLIGAGGTTEGIIGRIIAGVVGAIVLTFIVRTFSDNKNFGR